MPVRSRRRVPELVLAPATGATAPHWRWSPAEGAISVLNHAVYPATVIAAYEALTAGRRTLRLT